MSNVAEAKFELYIQQRTTTIKSTIKMVGNRYYINDTI